MISKCESAICCNNSVGRGTGDLTLWSRLFGGWTPLSAGAPPETSYTCCACISGGLTQQAEARCATLTPKLKGTTTFRSTILPTGLTLVRAVVTPVRLASAAINQKDALAPMKVDGSAAAHLTDRTALTGIKEVPGTVEIAGTGTMAALTAGTEEQTGGAEAIGGRKAPQPGRYSQLRRPAPAGI